MQPIHNQESLEGYKRGFEEGKKYVESCKEQNVMVMYPEFNKPKSSFEDYYIKGYKSAIAQLSGENGPSANQFINNHRKMGENCIDRMIKKNKSDNFLVTLGKRNQEYELTNFAEQVIRDLIKGKIVVSEYEKQFSNMRFIERLLQVMYMNIYYQTALAQCMSICARNMEDNTMEPTIYTPEMLSNYISYHDALLNIYIILYEAFSSFHKNLINGLFEPTCISMAQQTIEERGLSKRARDPFSKPRIRTYDRKQGTRKHHNNRGKR